MRERKPKSATSKKRTPSRKKTTPRKATSRKINNPYATEFMHIQKEIKKAYNKLAKDLKNHASPKTLQKDNNNLFLLLGECHYLARQCWQKTHPKRK